MPSLKRTKAYKRSTGGVFIASYVVNYIVLQLEDFALLAGTLVLAAILGALMLITGKVNQQESEKKDNA